jgi:ribonuclease HI
MGPCFRNSFGEFTARFTQWQQMVLSTEEGETWTLLQAMNEAKHRGFERVKFESDSQVLIEAICTSREAIKSFFPSLTILFLLCYHVTLK